MHAYLVAAYVVLQSGETLVCHDVVPAESLEKARNIALNSFLLRDWNETSPPLHFGSTCILSSKCEAVRIEVLGVLDMIVPENSRIWGETLSRTVEWQEEHAEVTDA